MTREEIEKLSDEELTELVATYVMGWVLQHIGYGVMQPAWMNSKVFQQHTNLWCPLTDMNDAWMVVDEVITKGFSITSIFDTEDQPGYLFWCCESANLGFIDYMVRADTQQRAICIAAALAVQE